MRHKHHRLRTCTAVALTVPITSTPSHDTGQPCILKPNRILHIPQACTCAWSRVRATTVRQGHCVRLRRPAPSPCTTLALCRCAAPHLRVGAAWTASKLLTLSTCSVHFACRCRMQACASVRVWCIFNRVCRHGETRPSETASADVLPSSASAPTLCLHSLPVLYCLYVQMCATHQMCAPLALAPVRASTSDQPHRSCQVCAVQAAEIGCM